MKVIGNIDKTKSLGNGNGSLTPGRAILYEDTVYVLEANSIIHFWYENYLLVENEDGLCLLNTSSLTEESLNSLTEIRLSRHTYNSI